MNFIFISPHFPHTYWQFCDRLKKRGVNVLGIGDTDYNALDGNLKNALTGYYRVSSLENYDEVYRAVAYFAWQYGKPDWLESNNEYWLEQDARLRTAFHITTGVLSEEIAAWKHKSAMKPHYIEAGIPVARCHKVTTPEAARAFLAEIGGFPVFVKPDVGVGAEDSYKLENEGELENFFARKADYPYLMEEFVTGNIYSYDAICNSRGEPLFESSSVFPPSIADMVNFDQDLSYYTLPSVPESLRKYGRAALKAFGVRSRFVHFEFFRLTKARPGLGEVGDFVGLEVNMRPAGGYTPDMMDYAHSTDVYDIWADMIVYDERRRPDSGDHHWCVYAARKDWHRYRHSHEEILARYGNQITMLERMPQIMWATMGCVSYTAHAWSQEEAEEYIRFIQEREA
ncbi:MAG: ATP-grasp domain-containing protein [bacterium]